VTELDKQRSATFLQTMTGIMNGGALALMCSIGHKTGLFDTMAGMEPATSAEIARAAGLDERYVREWLAAMTAGGVVDHEPGREGSGGTYHLPPEHGGLLTRAAGPLNLTTYCQYIALLGQVEDEVVEAFRSGGGVPYERYPRFQTLMAESSGQRLAGALIPQVVPLLPDGQARLEAGIDVVDVGCGSGRALNLLARTFPNSRFTGYDIAEGAIERARAEAAEHGTANIEFVRRDAAALDEHERFDLALSFDAIHDQAHPDRMLAGISAALRPGGTYLAVEPKASSHLHDNLDMPTAPMMYTISTMHCMTVSLAEGGMGLGTAWGEQRAIEMLTEAGFTDIRVTGIRADRANHYLLSRKGPDAEHPPLGLSAGRDASREVDGV
jgi:SAM-dependent methyltransferase